MLERGLAAVDVVVEQHPLVEERLEEVTVVVILDGGLVEVDQRAELVPGGIHEGVVAEVGGKHARKVHLVTVVSVGHEGLLGLWTPQEAMPLVAASHVKGTINRGHRQTVGFTDVAGARGDASRERQR